MIEKENRGIIKVDVSRGKNWLQNALAMGDFLEHAQKL
jgi:hypothetical protein